MLRRAAKDFEAFKVKQEKNKGNENKNTTETGAASGSDDVKKAADQEEEEESTPSIWPLSPLPVTHLLHWLLRDLLRKATLCTTRGQTPLRQMHYALKRVAEASQRILAAAQPVVLLSTEDKENWAAFEKQLQYESPEAGSIQSLFASCSSNPSAPAVPNAPAPPGPARAFGGLGDMLAASAGAAAAAAAASSAASSSSGSSASVARPVSSAASPSAPLLSTLLSTSLLTQACLPSLSFVWTTLFRPLLFDDINETQSVLRGTTEFPDTTEEEEAAAAEEDEEEKKASDSAAAAPASTPEPPTFNLLEVLLSLLRNLDAFNASLPSTAGEEALFERVSGAPLLSGAANPPGGGVVVETPHTYFSDLDDAQVVHIPCASYLVVEFDPRCSSERNRDHLTITVPQEEDMASQLGMALPQPPLKVAGPFHGPRDQWPKMPIVIQNTSTLVFNWYARHSYSCVACNLNVPFLHARLSFVCPSLTLCCSMHAVVLLSLI